MQKLVAYFSSNTHVARHNMRPFKFLAFLFLFVACKTKTDNNKMQTLDFGSFKLKAPKDWRIFKEQGIDSYVGGLTNGKDSLWFDLGWYSAEIKDDESKKHLYGQDTINGLIAIIEIPKVDGQGSIRLSIPKVNDKDKFNLGGYNIKGTETIFKIFKSVCFKNSDTTKNSNLTLAKFREYPLGSGRTLYYSTCAACHSRDKLMVGPALDNELLQTRSNDWLTTFFLDRKNLKIDSAYKARKKEFGDINCIELTDYKKEDIQQIISYLTGK